MSKRALLAIASRAQEALLRTLLEALDIAKLDEARLKQAVQSVPKPYREGGAIAPAWAKLTALRKRGITRECGLTHNEAMTLGQRLIDLFIVLNLFIAIVINNLEASKLAELEELRVPVTHEEVLRELARTREALARFQRKLEDIHDPGPITRRI